MRSGVNSTNAFKYTRCTFPQVDFTGTPLIPSAQGAWPSTGPALGAAEGQEGVEPKSREPCTEEEPSNPKHCPLACALAAQRQVPFLCAALEGLPAPRSRCRGPCGLAMKGPIVTTGQQGRERLSVQEDQEPPHFYVLRSVCFRLCSSRRGGGSSLNNTQSKDRDTDLLIVPSSGGF